MPHGIKSFARGASSPIFVWAALPSLGSPGSTLVNNTSLPSHLPVDLLRSHKLYITGGEGHERVTTSDIFERLASELTEAPTLKPLRSNAVKTVIN